MVKHEIHAIKKLRNIRVSQHRRCKDEYSSNTLRQSQIVLELCSPLTSYVVLLFVLQPTENNGHSWHNWKFSGISNKDIILDRQTIMEAAHCPKTSATETWTAWLFSEALFQRIVTYCIDIKSSAAVTQIFIADFVNYSPCLGFCGRKLGVKQPLLKLTSCWSLLCARAG